MISSFVTNIRAVTLHKTVGSVNELSHLFTISLELFVSNGEVWLKFKVLSCSVADPRTGIFFLCLVQIFEF